MATQSLDGLAVAVLVDDGFEQSELLKPREALDGAGATTRVVSPKDGRVRGWNHAEWGEQVKVDVPARAGTRRRLRRAAAARRRHEPR